MWTFEQMRQFAAGGRPEVRARTERCDRRNRGRYKVKPCFYSAVDYEAMILTLGYTGLRLGEVLALLESGFDGVSFEVEASGHEGELIDSSEEKNHERIVPSPPTLSELILRRADLPESEYLFATPRGLLFGERNFYRDVWAPAQLATGMDPTPANRHVSEKGGRAAKRRGQLPISGAGLD